MLREYQLREVVFSLTLNICIMSKNVEARLLLPVNRKASVVLARDGIVGPDVTPQSYLLLTRSPDRA